MTPEDTAHLIRDKYQGDTSADLTADIARLEKGEPLAYVIGWVPFLGLTIHLDSKPLIPRPETEWWVETLIAHLKDKYGDSEFHLLDLCAGSGVIGLSVLRALPHAKVTFGELIPEHVALIRKNIEANALDASRTTLYESFLFDAFSEEQFDVIATNPPYIPETRSLPESVYVFEPHEALFSGRDGLHLIRQILSNAQAHLLPTGELWMECDTENIAEAKAILLAYGGSGTIHEDLYGRPRLLVGQFN